jgi:hypothetical protein
MRIPFGGMLQSAASELHLIMDTSYIIMPLHPYKLHYPKFILYKSTKPPLARKGDIHRSSHRVYDYTVVRWRLHRNHDD